MLPTLSLKLLLTLLSMTRFLQSARELRVPRQKLHLLSQFLWFLRFKSEFKGQIASKYDLGLLNAYKLMYVFSLKYK